MAAARGHASPARSSACLSRAIGDASSVRLWPRRPVAVGSTVRRPAFAAAGGPASRQREGPPPGRPGIRQQAEGQHRARSRSGRPHHQERAARARRPPRSSRPATWSDGRGHGEQRQGDRAQRQRPGERARAARVEQPDVRHRDEQQRQVRIREPGEQHGQRRDQAKRGQRPARRQPRGHAPAPDRVVAGADHGSPGRPWRRSARRRPESGLGRRGTPAWRRSRSAPAGRGAARRPAAAAPWTPTRRAPSPLAPRAGSARPSASSEVERGREKQGQRQQGERPARDEVSRQVQVGVGPVLGRRRRRRRAWPPGAAPSAPGPRASRPRGRRAGRRRPAAAAPRPRTGRRRRCRARSARPARRARWGAPAAPAPRTGPRAAAGARPARRAPARRCARAGPRGSAVRPRRRAARARAGWPSRAARARPRRRSGRAPGSAPRTRGPRRRRRCRRRWRRRPASWCAWRSAACRPARAGSRWRRRSRPRRGRWPSPAPRAPRRCEATRRAGSGSGCEARRRRPRSCASNRCSATWPSRTLAKRLSTMSAIASSPFAPGRARRAPLSTIWRSSLAAAPWSNSAEATTGGSGVGPRPEARTAAPRPPPGPARTLHGRGGS